MVHQDRLVLALDVMGGDRGPVTVLRGAELALKQNPELYFILYGQQNKIDPLLAHMPALAAASTVSHTEDMIANDEKPSVALRRGRNSSMGCAIRAVRTKEAVAAVSAGNTGALMAMAKITLRTLPGIDRPAIGAVLPHQHGRYVMLDLGANVACDANNLFEFAVMGDAFARALLGLESPRVALLNIGSEDMKGHDVVQAAATMLRECDLQLNFQGYVEGDDLSKGVIDVVVTDGFTGNVALKTAEGTASLITGMLKKGFRESILARIGALFLLPMLKRIKKDLDPRNYNGAMFLGLNGIVVKSHGGADEIGIANAVIVAARLAKQRINEHIIKEMIQSGHILPEDGEAALRADDAEEQPCD